MACRIHDSRIRIASNPGSRSVVVTVAFLALGVMAASPSPAHAEDSEWQTYAAETRVDTVQAGYEAALAAAQQALEQDDWQLAEDRCEPGRLVTEWKRLRHALVRLTLGEARARCAVDLAPLGSGRTVIALRGAIASDRDLERSPAFGLAQATYRKAVERWFGRVQRLLAQGSGGSAGAGGAGRAVGASAAPAGGAGVGAAGGAGPGAPGGGAPAGAPGR
jgi:hypothetical protein